MKYWNYVIENGKKELVLKRQVNYNDLMVGFSMWLHSNILEALICDFKENAWCLKFTTDDERTEAIEYIKTLDWVKPWKAGV